MDFFHKHSKPKVEDKPGLKVKICGIRRSQAAEVAVSSGADYLGFNFVNSSRHFISPVHAREIINHVRHKAAIVGVFQNMPVHEVNELIGYLKLHVVQLHGREDAGYIQKIKAPVIKSVSLPRDFEVDQVIEHLQGYNAHHILLDREQQGFGEPVDLQTAAKITQYVPIFLAGGLDPVNVAEAVIGTNPYGVDVASGIETNGIEDVNKISQFVRNAKGVGK
ncbi:MAG: phosphoribosylanthranilate isomerase [Patescibacteria group bacterium]|nr:phosphoribosylanthranilate isomerase [Patescibacteria group bacterium]